MFALKQGYVASGALCLDLKLVTIEPMAHGFKGVNILRRTELIN